jgi:MFS superfamily sulfate permease-like transporter
VVTFWLVLLSRSHSFQKRSPFPLSPVLTLVGLYSAFCIPLVMAFFGGRPAMISSSTGAMALLMVTLVKDHGLQYLLAASILTGVFQLIAGYLKLGGLMRFVSRSVVTGFVNALAILIFMAQLPELTNVTWHVYAMTAAGLGIIYLFPYLNKTIPSPLVLHRGADRDCHVAASGRAHRRGYGNCPTVCRSSCSRICL